MSVKRKHLGDITAAASNDLISSRSCRPRHDSPSNKTPKLPTSPQSTGTHKPLIVSTAQKSVKTFSAAWGDSQRKLPVTCPELVWAFYEWIAERHRLSVCTPNEREAVFEASDRVLKQHMYCNVYRIQDRGTQFLLAEVLAKGPQDLYELVFRLLIYRVFNKIATWKHLVNSHFGPTLTWKDFNIDQYVDVLENRPDSHGALYTGAYQVTSSKELGNDSPLHVLHLRFIHVAMSSGLPARLAGCRYYIDAYNLLLQYPGIGPFNANQLALDFNLLEGISYPEDEWVGAGPGAMNCLRKMFGPSISSSDHAMHAMRYLQSEQDSHWARIGYTPRLSPDCARTGVTLADIEHALCEVDKWSRGAMPWIKSSHSSPGNIYVPRRGERPAMVLPPKLRGGKTGMEGRETDEEMIARRQPMEGVDEDEYEISHIVGYASGGRLSKDPVYRVRWTDYPFDEDTRKTRSSLLEEAPKIVEEWDHLQNDIQHYIKESLKLG